MSAQPIPSEPITRILNQLQGVKRSADGWVARCPAHDDAHASLSVRIGQDDRALLYCHTGCSLESVTAALGMSESELFVDRPTNGAAEHTIHYEIRDAAGTLMAIHDRTDPGKKFSWRQPNGQIGLGGIKTADLPLYGSQHIAEWEPDEAIIVTEGEKDADSLTAKQFAALASITGASSTPSAASLAVLKGRRVLLWPDNDQPGTEHMQRIAKVLRGIASEVRLIRWDNAPAKAGAADCIGLEGEEAVVRLVAAATPIQVGRSFSTDREIHTAIFDAQDVRIEFDLIRTDSHGETFGEATFYVGGSAEPLHKSRLNLLSTLAKQTLANALGRRTAPADLAWDEMIEWASLRALTAFRRGSSPVPLNSVADPPPQVDLLGPLISPSGVTIFFGDGGSGKSQIVQAMALSIHENYNLLGFQPSVQLNVLYLDWEEEDWVHRDRMRRLLGEESGMLYLRMSHSLSQSVDQLRPIVRDEHIGLIVVDSLAPASGGDANEQVTADSFFSAQRRLEVPIVCTAHNTKAQDDQKPFGSTFYHNLARRTWYVKNNQERDSPEMTVGLFNRKNNLGPRYHDIAYKLTFTPERTMIQTTDMRLVPQLQSNTSLRERIMALLADGPLTANEVAKELGYDSPSGIQTVRNTLNAGEGKVFVKFRTLDRGYRWGLLARDSDTN